MISRLSAVVLCLGLAACGSPVEEDELASEDVSEAEEELGTLGQALSPSCGVATPHFTYTTGTMYPTPLVTNGGAGCTKIVDIDNIDLVNYLPPVLSPNQVPTNQADCENTRVVEYLWDKTDPTPVYLGSLSEYGVWDSYLGCDLAAFPPAALVSGRSYRFGVSAQRPKYTYIDLKFRSVYFH